jgi:hypothetical protein
MRREWWKRWVVLSLLAAGPAMAQAGTSGTTSGTPPGR